MQEPICYWQYRRTSIGGVRTFRQGLGQHLHTSWESPTAFLELFRLLTPAEMTSCGGGVKIVPGVTSITRRSVCKGATHHTAANDTLRIGP